MTSLYELATRVKKGVKHLDKLVPNWRRTIQAHKDEFDFSDGDCCVLGTLEHYNGRMRVLKARKKIVTDCRFDNAARALGIASGASKDYGFDGHPGEGYYTETQQLSDLWKVEIGL